MSAASASLRCCAGAREFEAMSSGEVIVRTHWLLVCGACALPFVSASAPGLSGPAETALWNVVAWSWMLHSAGRCTAHAVGLVHGTQARTASALYACATIAFASVRMLLMTTPDNVHDLYEVAVLILTLATFTGETLPSIKGLRGEIRVSRPPGDRVRELQPLFAALMLGLLIFSVALERIGGVGPTVAAAAPQIFRACALGLLLTQTSYCEELVLSEALLQDLKSWRRCAFFDDKKRVLLLGIDFVGIWAYTGVLAVWPLLLGLSSSLTLRVAANVLMLTWVPYAGLSLVPVLLFARSTCTGTGGIGYALAVAASAFIAVAFVMELAARMDPLLGAHGAAFHVSVFDTAQAALLHASIYTGVRSGHYRALQNSVRTSATQFVLCSRAWATQ